MNPQQQTRRSETQVLDGQPLDIMSNAMSPHLNDELTPSPIMMPDSHRKSESPGFSSQDAQQQN